MSAISLKNLDISYGPTKVVQSVDIEVAEGESFALVGESGSGKSTVLKAIAGLAPEWTGEISVLGQPRGHKVDHGFARRCQMVFQDPYASLHPRKTVDAVLSSHCRCRASATAAAAWSRCWPPSGWTSASASAFRTSSRAGSASGWPSPGR